MPLAPTDFAAVAKYLRFEIVDTVGAVIEEDILSTVGDSSEILPSSSAFTVEISKHFEGGCQNSQRNNQKKVKQETNIHKMATKGDFVVVEDPTLPEGWTKKV